MIICLDCCSHAQENLLDHGWLGQHAIRVSLVPVQPVVRTAGVVAQDIVILMTPIRLHAGAGRQESGISDGAPSSYVFVVIPEPVRVGSTSIR